MSFLKRALANRVLAYFAMLTACAGALFVSIHMLLAVGIAALPASLEARHPPRIAAWIERRAVALPELPKPHGPAMTAEEIRAYAPPARTAPAVRIPIMAMTEDEPPVRARPNRPPAAKQRKTAQQHARQRQAQSTTAVQAQSTTAEAEQPSYTPTARERYAPERNF